MQAGSKQEFSQAREDAPSSHSSAGKRANQGYVTLSPARKGKDRSRLERNS